MDTDPRGPRATTPPVVIPADYHDKVKAIAQRLAEEARSGTLAERLRDASRTLPSWYIPVDLPDPDNMGDVGVLIDAADVVFDAIGDEVWIDDVEQLLPTLDAGLAGQLLHDLVEAGLRPALGAIAQGRSTVAVGPHIYSGSTWIEAVCEAWLAALGATKRSGR
jgi:hypothetical protein